MSKTLNQSHVLYLSDTRLDLPTLIVNHFGSISELPLRKKSWFKLFNNLKINWQVRNIHSAKPVDIIIINHPKYLSDGLRSFTQKFNIPLIADTLTHSFNLNLINRQKYQGYILASHLINGTKAAVPVEDHTAIVPVLLAKSKYWQSAGYKSQILKISVIALNPDPTDLARVSSALDVVKSLNPDLEIDIISANDYDPTPLTQRIHHTHLIINVSRDPVWLETTAAAVAAGIPIISPKRPIHQYIHPNQFPGYIIADWQVDTLSTIIQNSVYHPEETYRIAKNSQHWLKSNLGSTFLPLSWVNAVNQLVAVN